MPRRPALLLALLALLAAAPSAHAKQINSMAVCGNDGCRDVDRAIGQALHGAGSAPTVATPRRAPHYRFILRIGDDQQTFGTDRLVYVPSAQALGGAGGWWRVDRGTAAKLQDALATRRPLPAAELPSTAAAIARPDSNGQPEVITPPASTPAEAADGGPAWWTFAAGGLLAAALAVGLWRLRRGRVTTA